MFGEKWNIYWNEYTANTYLYGSEIEFIAKNNVIFKNDLMPPGTVIKEWFSKTNYQANRIEPTLPIIDGEGEYQITVNVETEEDEHCLIRLVFYDRYENIADTLTVSESQARFKCPLKTYSYSIQLINGGLTKLVYHSMTIREIIDEDKRQP